VDAKVPIRLCIYQAMKSKDISKQQSALVKEAKEFSSILQHVVLVHFYKSYSINKITENATLITIPYIEPKSPTWLLLSIFFSYILSIPTLAIILGKYRINLIRADDVVVTAFPSLLLSFFFGSKLIINILGNVEEILPYKIGKKRITLSFVTFITRHLERFVIQRAFACIVVNNQLIKIAKHYGAKKVFLCYPNVDLSSFLNYNIDNSIEKFPDFSVLFVGRLEPEKGAINIIPVAEKMSNINFLIAGYGSQEKEILNMIDKKKINNIKLLGIVDHDNLPSVYSKSHVLLLPSYSEGLPVVMIEAMASGIPVIVSDVGAVKEILDKSNAGFVVSVGSTNEIISKLQILITNEKLRQCLGERGRSFAQLTFDGYIENQIEIFKKILE
jgi:glycosyltransferase involved in cell wall biosynthesis